MRIVDPQKYDTIKNSDFVVVKWTSESTVIMEYGVNDYISARLSMDPKTWIDKWHAPSKANYCMQDYSHANTEAIIFENYREMVTWLAKEENGR